MTLMILIFIAIALISVLGYTHTLKYAYDGADGNTVTAEVPYTGDAQIQFDANFVIGTNAEADIYIRQAGLKALIIVCSTATTIKTNSSGAPDDTLTLGANIPVVWGASDVAACPLTADVTKIYVTNVAASRVRIRALYDSTP